MQRKQKRNLIRIILSIITFIIVAIIDNKIISNITYSELIRLIPYLIPYIIIAYDIVLNAFRNIKNGNIFDENFLMMIATFGAFAIGEYSEAVAVMLFYQVGELFQDYAVNKSRQSITEMMDICPEYANLERDNEVISVDPDDVNIGDIIIIKPGERVPLDGVVIAGESFLDTSALTGEPVPRRVCEGTEVISGCINGSGTLKVRVGKEFEDSTVAKILELVENASSKKAKAEKFITSFARYYTPIVTISAALLAILPPIILGGGFGEWIQRACIFLVVSCPCALVISVPLSFFGGVGAASKAGILVKGSNFLEAVSKANIVVFDKTGTITKGEFKVTEVVTYDYKTEEVIELATLGEAFSNHPIAESIKNEYGKNIDINCIDSTEEVAGYGIKANVKGKELLVGNKKLMIQNNITFDKAISDDKTPVFVSYEGKPVGIILISDTIKDETSNAISTLKKNGISKCVMLTGDKQQIAENIASKVGIDEVFAELLPGDKVTCLENILESNSTDKKVMYVGDGINDAPVITRADIGIAMGSMGSDAAIEAADIVIMDDDIRKIPILMKISEKTLKIVRQNIVFALAVKIGVLIIGALGFANMWEAVFADVGVAVICILNAMRILKK